MADYAANFSTPLTGETPFVDLLNALGFSFTIAAPALMLLGLAWHAFSTKAGRPPVAVVVALLAGIFADMAFLGGGLVQVLAQALFLAAWMPERTPESWLGPNAASRDASRPHSIKWTHSRGSARSAAVSLAGRRLSRGANYSVTAHLDG